MCLRRLLKFLTSMKVNVHSNLNKGEIYLEAPHATFLHVAVVYMYFSLKGEDTCMHARICHLMAAIIALITKLKN
jgi:hypothetical protein